MKYIVVVDQRGVRLESGDGVTASGPFHDMETAEQVTGQLNQLSEEGLYDLNYIAIVPLFDGGIIGPHVKALIANSEKSPQ